MMDKQKMYREKAFLGLFLLLIFSTIVFQLSQERNDGQVVPFLRENPIFMLFLAAPLFFWLVFLIKGNPKDKLKNFLSKHLMKHVSRFISLVIASFLTYFVLLSGEVKSFIDYLIAVFLTIVAFALFLLSSWFGEAEFYPLDKKGVTKLLRDIKRPFLFTVIPLTLLTLINYFILQLSLVPSFSISALLSLGLIMSISPLIFGKKLSFVLKLFLQIMVLVTLYYMYLDYRFNLSRKNFVILAVVMGILMPLLWGLSAYYKNSSWFKKLTKGIFYE